MHVTLCEHTSLQINNNDHNNMVMDAEVSLSKGFLTNTLNQQIHMLSIKLDTVISQLETANAKLDSVHAGRCTRWIPI
jgi:hypothetical protein